MKENNLLLLIGVLTLAELTLLSLLAVHYYQQVKPELDTVSTGLDKVASLASKL